MTDEHVIVVGAGPVGLLNALGLAQAGVRVTVLEQESTIVASPRAMAYHWAALDGLQRLGILDELITKGLVVRELAFVIRSTGERIRRSIGVCAPDTNYPFHLHLGQDKLAEVAFSRLANFPHAKVEWNANLINLDQDANSVTVIADTDGERRRFRAHWLVGADGGRSTVRRLLNLSFEGITWPERFVATNIYYRFDDYDFAKASMMIDPVYGAIIAKIDSDGLWRCTFSESADLPVEGLRERIDAWMEVALPGPKKFELSQFSPYKMHQRCVERMRIGRVVLAGDAAHITNPTGGLGLTTGLFDTYVLHEALAAVCRGEADDAVLDVYSRERINAFQTYASPRASQLKRFIFNSTNPAELENALDNMRRQASDPELARKAMAAPKNLATPSLLR